MTPLDEQGVEAAAERISDLLTMLNVDPDERQVENVHGAPVEMGDDVKTIIATAALTAYFAALDRKALVERVLADLVDWRGDGGYRRAVATAVLDSALGKPETLESWRAWCAAHPDTA